MYGDWMAELRMNYATGNLTQGEQLSLSHIDINSGRRNRFR